MLTLKNFETELPGKILQKGREYYQNGAVSSLEETDKNVWEAEVEGNETYELEIQLKKDGTVKESFCDCPFEGAVCKHVAAVLFAISDTLAKPQGKEAKLPSKIAFDNLLQKITLSEYQDFIKQYAAQNKTFKTQFEIQFADKDERIDLNANYEKLIKKSIQLNSNQGFVDYQGSYGLAGDIGKILESGSNFIKNKNYRQAFAIAQPALRLLLDAIAYADDSEGNIGSLIDDAGQLIADIVESPDAAIELKEQVYVFLETQMNNKSYFDYGDFGYDLFETLAKLAVHLNKAAQFMSLIEKLTALYNGEYENYKREFFQKQKIAFYEATGNKAQAEKLIAENINIVEVRAGLVNKAIAKMDFVTAKKLINDGIQVAESNRHPGTVTNWEKVLLKIAVLEKDTPTVRRYSKMLAFDQWFNTEYYRQWKKTYSAGEWPAVIENHIRETTETITRQHEKNKNKLWRPGKPPLLEDLAPIYIEEKYWDRMLALVKKETQLNNVWKYHPYLSKAYPAELIEIYIPMFIAEADAASTRSHYAELASQMKKVIKDIPEGKEKITALAKNLQLKYPRRPAMVQELNMVLK